MFMFDDTKPKSPNVSTSMDNTLVAALLISQSGKRVLVACHDQQRIEKLGKAISKITGCPDYSMSRAGQAPTASLVDAINGTALINFVRYDVLPIAIPRGLDLKQWDVIVDFEGFCSVITVPRSGDTD